jgi:hypothetical protein
VSNPPIPYGDTMDDDEELSFTIDHNGVHFRAPVRGKKRFLLERAFLDDLVGEFAPRNKTRPVPDPSTDFYLLSDEQLDAYSAFRHRMEREAG